MLYTLSEISEGYLKEKGSRFFAYAYPLREIEEVAAKIQELKKKYHDARHHCYAYRMGKEGEEVYANDDGEPSHSAGDPILAAIRSAELTGVLIVVVRYFGGTKLGIRGLIEAYKGAANAAIAQNELVPVIPKIIFQIQYPYERTSDINRILHRFTVEIVEAQYTDECIQTLSIQAEAFEDLHSQLVMAQLACQVIERT